MHVAIVSDYGHVNGGASQAAITSAQALAERGCSVSFICGVEPIDPVLGQPNISVHHLDLDDVWTDRNPLRAAVHGIWNRRAAARLGAVLAALPEAETIVHFHQWTKALSPSAIGVVAEMRLRQVHTLHDYFAFCPNGTYFDHGRQQPCHRRPLSAGCMLAGCDTRSRAHKAVRVIRQAASNAALRRARQPLNSIHVSEFARAVALPFVPPNCRHFVVHNPITLAQVPPSPVRANSAFIYLGRFTPEKGAHVFAAAARAANVAAIFRGAGPEHERIRRANPEAQPLPWGAGRGGEGTSRPGPRAGISVFVVRDQRSRRPRSAGDGRPRGLQPQHRGRGLD